MLSFRFYTLLFIIFAFNACKNPSETVEIPVNSVLLEFENTFKEDAIHLKTENSSDFSIHYSDSAQSHHFSEIKYVISQIHLIRADQSEFAYHPDNLDEGAFLINQANPESLKIWLSQIPEGEYVQIRFGLGVPFEINHLDEEKFPKFYAMAGAHEAEMHWEWGLGYRFAKIEGQYGEENKKFIVHIGSTWQGTKNDTSTYVQGVDAYREILLDLPETLKVENSRPHLIVQADFHKLLSGHAHNFVLDPYNALPTRHTSENMLPFLDNLGGDPSNNSKSLFQIKELKN